MNLGKTIFIQRSTFFPFGFRAESSMRWPSRLEPSSVGHAPRRFGDPVAPPKKRMSSSPLHCLLAAALLAPPAMSARAADSPVPHGQQKPPGPPLSPQEAIAKMRVPEG